MNKAIAALVIVVRPGGRPVLRRRAPQAERCGLLHQLPRDARHRGELARVGASRSGVFGMPRRRTARRATFAVRWRAPEGDLAEHIRMQQISDLDAVTERCRGCHQQEYSAWRAGPHAVSYSQIFTDKAHNREAHPDGRLLPLPRHVFPGNHDANGVACRYERAVEIGGQHPGEAVGHSVHLLPPGASTRRADAAGRAQADHCGNRPAGADAFGCFLRSPVRRSHSAGPAARSGHAGGLTAGEDEPRPEAGALLPVPRAFTRISAGAERRRPDAGGSSRGDQLPRVPPEPRTADAGILRDVPSEDVELRSRRREDGYDLQDPDERAQHTFREVPGLPREGRTEETAFAGQFAPNARLIQGRSIII